MLKTILFSFYFVLFGALSAFADVLRIGKSINPGMTRAPLVVVSEAELTAGVNWQTDKVYVLPRTPPVLKPVAGVITVSSGSAISHVQLLCRGLGIPNVAITDEEYKALKPLNGQPVFFAAKQSTKSILKPASEMTEADTKLFQKYVGATDVNPIVIPSPNLTVTNLMTLDQLKPSDSGQLTGPKAANLAGLKKLFPTRVADGFAIPFGRINQIFIANGIDKLINELSQLTGADALVKLSEITIKIRTMPVPKDFEDEVIARSKVLLEANNGAGLFVRSDTNVEDLQKFSGAGLNKTVPNVISLDKIMDTVREVWASPWTERAYAWRVKYISNPNAILPSVLIMKSIDSHRSGVMVGENLETGALDDFYVSAMEGLGFSVVDGYESPEEWLVKAGQSPIDQRADLLQAVYAKKQLVLDNVNGGIKSIPTTLDEICSADDLKVLEEVIKKSEQAFGPNQSWDMEFGFDQNGYLQLFQIRPFIKFGNTLTQATIRELYALYE